MARGSSFEHDRAVSVASMMMCELKLSCSRVAMFTSAKCMQFFCLHDKSVL
jgi:hypothetical protein